MPLGSIKPKASLMKYVKNKYAFAGEVVVIAVVFTPIITDNY